MNDSDETIDQLRRVASGDASARDELFSLHRDRLRRLVRLRLDRRLHGLVDEAEVVEDALGDAADRIVEYLESSEQSSDASFFLWLRQQTLNRLAQRHEELLGALSGDADQSVSIYHGPLPTANSISLAEQLLGTLASPAEEVVRAEERLLLQEALGTMDPLDREILALRHFEQLSNSETALVLGVSPAAAMARHVRVIKKVGALLEDPRPLFGR